jgi:hypothetical protein
MNSNDEEALNALKKLEGENLNPNENNTHIEYQEDIESLNPKGNNSQPIQSIETDSPPNIVDGYKILDKSELPLNGVLYPESWMFAYRCPKVSEVANFSTISPTDTVGILLAIGDLVRKCVKIYDVDSKKEISSEQINDTHRMLFLLKLREFYLPGSTVKYDSMCTIHNSPYEANLKSNMLEYHDIDEKLLECFDGRIFTINGEILRIPELKDSIVIHIPTIGNSTRLFQYVINFHNNRNPKERENKSESSILKDKKFFLFAPYLFQTGNEPIKQIIQRYKDLEKNELLFKAYFNLINKLKFDALETVIVDCPVCGAEEVTAIQFPEWAELFIEDYN